jgi:hypothetical protein
VQAQTATVGTNVYVKWSASYEGVSTTMYGYVKTSSLGTKSCYMLFSDSTGVKFSFTRLDSDTLIEKYHAVLTSTILFNGKRAKVTLELNQSTTAGVPHMFSLSITSLEEDDPDAPYGSDLIEPRVDVPGPRCYLYINP